MKVLFEASLLGKNTSHGCQVSSMLVHTTHYNLWSNWLVVALVLLGLIARGLASEACCGAAETALAAIGKDLVCSLFFVVASCCVHFLSCVICIQFFIAVFDSYPSTVARQLNTKFTISN